MKGPNKIIETELKLNIKLIELKIALFLIMYSYLKKILEQKMGWKMPRQNNK